MAKSNKAPSSRKRKQSLAPKTTPPDPEKAIQPIYLTVRQTAGVRVNEDTALTLSAVWACVRVISETLAGLPWHVYRRRNDGGFDVQPDHPNNWILDTQPSPETPAFQFREAIVAHALTWGNGYAEIERNVAGEPVWLWLITPDRVTLERINGRLMYAVDNDYAPTTYLEQNDVFHLRGLTYDGLNGYNVIRMFARAIGLGISLEDSAATFLGNDSTPGGLLETDKTLSETTRQTLLDSWNRRHLGPSNRRNVAVLEGGLKWKPTGAAPEDSQLVQQRQLTPSDICRIYRVPPHKVADLTRSTNNNIEHQELEFVNDTLRPWAERLETEADIKLFGRNNRGRLCTILSLDELKRGDMAARKEFNSAMLDRGVFSINDVLKRENMNPIGSDGDKRFVPLNMQLLENAGEEPLPVKPVTPAATPAAEEPKPADSEKMSRLTEGYMLLMQDALRRITAREKANSHLTGDAMGQWLGKHREYCREALMTSLEMLAVALDSKSPRATAAVAFTAFIDARFQQPSDDSDYMQQAEKLRTMVMAACAACKE